MVESEYVLEYHISQPEEAHGHHHNKLRKAGSLPIADDQNLYIAFSHKLTDSARYTKILSDATKTMKDNGHLYLQPPVGEFSLMAYKEGQEIADKGYLYGIEELKKWQSALNP